jgi:hypothetical protein
VRISFCIDFRKTFQFFWSDKYDIGRLVVVIDPAILHHISGALVLPCILSRQWRTIITTMQESEGTKCACYLHNMFHSTRNQTFYKKMARSLTFFLENKMALYGFTRSSLLTVKSQSSPYFSLKSQMSIEL